MHADIERLAPRATVLRVDPLKLVESSPGEHSLLMQVGELAVDEAIVTAGHEPNGYFWEGVAQFLIASEKPEIASIVNFDSEGGMFCAFGDQAALRGLGDLMAPLIADSGRLGSVIRDAESSGFEFDD